MKKIFKVFSVFVFLLIPLSLFSQDATIVLEYMHVEMENTGDYIAVEKEWKKIHQARIDAGIITGWQLWRNVYAAADDPYQYITINWYENYAKTFEDAPEGIFDDVLTDKEWEELYTKTMKSRTLGSREVMHRALNAEGSESGKYVVINHMRVKPGMENAYMDVESEIWKPYQEEAIKRGMKANWGVWVAWPYKEGQSRYSSVDGYNSMDQMMMGDNILEDVHPGMTWEEIDKKTSETRRISSIEIWEIVDAVWGE